MEGHLRINYQVANAGRIPIFADDQIVLSYTFHELDSAGKEVGTEWGGGNAVYGGPGPVKYDLLKGVDRADWTDAVRGSTTSPLDRAKDDFDPAKSYVECNADVFVRYGPSGRAQEFDLHCTATAVRVIEADRKSGKRSDD